MNKKENSAQDDIRKQLEDMLLGGEQLDEKSANAKPIANDGEDGALSKVQHPNTRSMDFYQVKEDAEDESSKLLKSVIEFYLDAKIIKKNEYVKAKKLADEKALSNIVFSTKFLNHSIIKIMEEIDMGNIHPRLLEVLGQLQGQLMATVKMQSQYLITTENGYRKIKEDHDRNEFEKQLDANKSETSSDNLNITEGQNLKIRGTKNLMLGIKTQIEDAPFEEVKETKPRLTDPTNRPVNPSFVDKPKTDEEETNDFDIDEELF